MKKVLVVGCGGIGERHLRCFLKTNRTEVSFCEVSSTRRNDITQKYDAVGFPDFESAWQKQNYNAVVICTPADSHIDFAIDSITRGASVLIEKPLSVSLDKVDLLQKKMIDADAFVRIAYVNRVRPGVNQVFELCRSGELGPVLQVSVVSGQHFPSYRPDFQRIYYARHATGGGAIQDALTHLVNLVEWFIGPTDNLFAQAARQQLEGVEVEDTVNINARNDKALVSYSLNQFQASNETSIYLHCAKASIKIEFHNQSWSIFHFGQSDWKHFPAPVPERDDMFIAQANAFLDGMEGTETSLCTLEEGIQTLRFNLAAIESVKTGKLVCLNG